MFTQKRVVLTLAAALVAAPVSFAQDFGQMVENLLRAQSGRWFGVVGPLGSPATEADYVARESATANQRVKLAAGLQAHYVTRKLASPGDMIAFWPNDTAPTHLFICIEGGRDSGGTNPGVQRVSLTQDLVETVMFGTDRCDGIRRTAWGTILATEETDTGATWEIINPTNTTNQWIEDRATGMIRTSIGGSAVSQNIVKRPALPIMAWEGLTVLPTGVVIGGDELRPGTGTLDTDGGAIFKFVPQSPFNGTTAISSLSQSPLSAGNTYALTISCQGGTSNPQYGQGCEIGNGVWVEVDPANARQQADEHGATGYYRPEDLHSDPTFEGRGIRFCWTNTGNEGGKNYAETMCAVDPKAAPEAPNQWLDTRTNFRYLTDGGTGRSNMVVTEVNRFIEGDTRFNSMDNLAFQPVTGNVYVVEDHDYGEIWACLPDGGDRDIKSDGCISILSIIDPEAEPTGFIFDGTGKTAYVVVQHGETPTQLNDADGRPTDDLLRITGFRINP